MQYDDGENALRFTLGRLFGKSSGSKQANFEATSFFLGFC